MKTIQNISGNVYNQLTALNAYERRLEGSTYRTFWEFKCVCGTIKMINARAVKCGNTKSCGCRVKGMDGTIYHGNSQKRLYNVWYAMKNRCNNPSHVFYHRYGGRGIKVCAEWENDFLSFEKWALNNGHEDNLTIERQNNNRGYSPENCVWTTIRVQQQNRSTARLLEFEGVTKNLAQWVSLSGIGRGQIKNRLNKGLTLNEIFKEFGYSPN